MTNRPPRRRNSLMLNDLQRFRGTFCSTKKTLKNSCFTPPLRYNVLTERDKTKKIMQEYVVKVKDSGDKWWRQNDKLHRLDGPAIERSNGSKAWYQNDNLHRLDGPAFENSNGNKTWYQNGKLHREDGPAVELANGDKEWYQNDELHRLDGPAVERSNGNKYWHQNDKLHRLDGPAVEDADGYKAWYIDGIKLTEEEFNNRNNKVEVTLEDIAKAMNIDVKKLRIKE